MKHLKKYNLFESYEYQEDVDNIIDIMLGIIDEFSRTYFDSTTGSMNFNDYSEKNDKYKSFKPVYKAGNKIRSRFSIRFFSIKSYENLNWLITEMSSVIGRLNDIGWILQDMNLGRVSVSTSGEGTSFSELVYSFIKPDVIISDDLPKAEEIEKVFNDNTQLVTHKGDIYVYDTHVNIGFDAKTYDGEIPEDVDSEFQRVADILGFTDFGTDSNDKWGVTFWFD
jgi:hypothetical protein